MPKTVKHEIKVTELRKGDRFADTGTPITSITRKQKWALIELNDERSVRMQLDALVIITREEPTEEEAQEIARDFARHALASDLRKALDATPYNVLTSTLKEMEPDSPHVLTWSSMTDVLKTQARYSQALRIRAHLVRGGYVALPKRQGDFVTVEDATFQELVDAYAVWLYDVTRYSTLIGNNVDPTSRSTSVISNLLEDLDDWAMRGVLDQLRWSGAWDAVQARVDEFREMERKAREARNA